MSGTDCEQILADVEHYLHGELGPARSRELEEHLALCHPCLERTEFRRRLKDIVRAKCRSSAPDDLLRRIRASLQWEAERGTPDR